MAVGSRRTAEPAVAARAAWAGTLAGEGRVKPWPWTDTWPVARLQVPRLGIDEIVLAGASGRTLAFGPGHLDGTAAPGSPGVSVLSGHRDTHFEFLGRVRPGERIRVQSPDGRWHEFTALAPRVVDARHAALVLNAREPLLTLVTCYPFHARVPGGPLRYVINAVSVPAAASGTPAPAPAAQEGSDSSGAEASPSRRA
ncbi:MAG TPA: class GN sortase [Gammaproteobacteria bacterium]|nr:class GN sortase [Gammaproteobacteria bacterium]